MFTKTQFELNTVSSYIQDKITQLTLKSQRTIKFRLFNS